MYSLARHQRNTENMPKLYPNSIHGSTYNFCCWFFFLESMTDKTLLRGLESPFPFTPTLLLKHPRVLDPSGLSLGMLFLFCDQTQDLDLEVSSLLLNSKPQPWWLISLVGDKMNDEQLGKEKCSTHSEKCDVRPPYHPAPHIKINSNKLRG